MFPSQHTSLAISETRNALNKLYDGEQSASVLPDEAALSHARESLIQHLPEEGLGVERVVSHLQKDIAPALNGNSLTPNYYGFVTGGSTPVASLADNFVTAYDQNVQVHLPNDTIATEVEDKALLELCELLDLDTNEWRHRTFTTGATASNVTGLACGREFVIAEASAAHGNSQVASVGEVGIFAAMRAAGLDKIQILTTVPHSSLSKAASLVGLGRDAVKSIGLSDSPHKFDMIRLEECLKEYRTASIVAISCGEVNTGCYATSNLEEMQSIRKLCDLNGAWIHVDGAFGMMGRLLSGPEYSIITAGCAGIELADSITGDGHKLLNVPYDCGFFLSRHPDIAPRVFQNPNAAYLSTGPASAIPSPLNIGIENSRRFRALPVYATLSAYGRAGYRDMLERQMALTRGIAAIIFQHPDYELLPQRKAGTVKEAVQDVFIIVLFRARDEKINAELVKRINGTKRIYVSGTAWEGRPACRFAVSNWKVDVERDLEKVKGVLEEVVRG